MLHLHLITDKGKKESFLIKHLNIKCTGLFFDIQRIVIIFIDN